MGTSGRGIFRANNQCLAEHGTDTTRLLCINENGSIIRAEDDIERETHNYTIYGYATTIPSTKTLNGFNGEMLDPVIQSYSMGAGYRAYSSTLLRFHRPDNLSPFGLGGLNAYAYCNGDPINTIDPSGHSGFFMRLIKGIGNMFGLRRRGERPPPPTNAESTSQAGLGVQSAKTPSAEIDDNFSLDSVSDIHPTSIKSLPANFYSTKKPGFDAFKQLKKRDPGTHTFLWSRHTENFPNGAPFQGLAEDIMIDSVNASLVAEWNGMMKDQQLMTATIKFPANKPHLLHNYKGNYYNYTARIQQTIRKRNI